MAAHTYLANIPGNGVWTEVANDKGTVILSAYGTCDVAIADAQADLDAIESGHRLSVKSQPLRFEGLGTKNVFIKAAEACHVAVTGYTPA